MTLKVRIEHGQKGYPHHVMVQAVNVAGMPLSPIHVLKDGDPPLELYVYENHHLRITEGIPVAGGAIVGDGVGDDKVVHEVAAAKVNAVGVSDIAKTLGTDGT